MSNESTNPTDGSNQDSLDKGTDSVDKGASEDTQEDDLKLDVSDLDPNVAKIVEEKVKGFQADYTRKTQAIKQKEKEMADDIEEGRYWKNWHSENKDGIAAYNDSLEKAKDSSNAPDNTSSSFDDTADDVFGDEGVKKAMQANAATKKELEEQMTSGFNMLVDLFALQNKDEFRELKVDPKKVVEFAIRKKTTDMKEAVEGCYRDQIEEQRFQKRLQEEKSKWEEQAKTNVLNVNMPVGRTARKVLAKVRQ